MTKRNLWGYEETLTLLNIIEEKECLQKIEEKKYKTNQIYQIIEQEMFNRGYYDKNAKQMEFRWQNLKKIFYKDRKLLQADKSHKVSPYFTQMEYVLSNRISKKETVADVTEAEDSTMNAVISNSMENGNFASSEEELELEQELEVPKTDMPAFEECFPSLPSSKPRIHLKRTREQPVVATPKVETFQQKIKQVAKELNEDLFRKQKELIEYEFRLFANYTNGRDEKFKEMMSTNTQTFLCGIKDLLQENTFSPKVKMMKTRSSDVMRQSEIEDSTIKQFFQSWDQEPGNRK